MLSKKLFKKTFRTKLGRSPASRPKSRRLHPPVLNPDSPESERATPPRRPLPQAAPNPRPNPSPIPSQTPSPLAPPERPHLPIPISLAFTLSRSPSLLLLVRLSRRELELRLETTCPRPCRPSSDLIPTSTAAGTPLRRSPSLRLSREQQARRSTPRAAPRIAASSPWRPAGRRAQACRRADRVSFHLASLQLPWMPSREPMASSSQGRRRWDPASLRHLPGQVTPGPTPPRSSTPLASSTCR